MNIELRVQRAIDIFLDALNEGTLAKGTCVACAVGNLVAAGMNGVITSYNDFAFRCNKPNNLWAQLFCTGYKGKQRVFKSNYNNSGVISCVEATEFSIEELMQIENTFERNTQIPCTEYYVVSKERIREDQIKGLEAVVKVMLSFSDSKEDVKEVFTKKAELIPIK